MVVIVPLHRDSARFRYCLERLSRVKYPSEIVVVTDGELPPLPNGVIGVSTGSRQDTAPGVKRDIGFLSSDSKYVAYIDDDAYPRDDWLHEAVKILEANPKLAGVGGPGLTPPESSPLEKLSGAIYESPFGSGPLRYRFLAQPAREVDDLPAYNFVARRDAIRAVGGWGTTYYGGEDTKLCLELVKAHFALTYSPNVVVFHMRRRVLAPHLRQVWNVGLHRGFFFKTFPETSRRLKYLAPLLSIILGGGFLASLLLDPTYQILAMSVVAGAVIIMSIEALPRVGGFGATLLPFLIATHHFAYSAGFLQGLLRKSLDR